MKREKPILAVRPHERKGLSNPTCGYGPGVIVTAACPPAGSMGSGPTADVEDDWALGPGLWSLLLSFPFPFPLPLLVELPLPLVVPFPFPLSLPFPLPCSRP